MTFNRNSGNQFSSVGRHSLLVCCVWFTILNTQKKQKLAVLLLFGAIFTLTFTVVWFFPVTARPAAATAASAPRQPGGQREGGEREGCRERWWQEWSWWKGRWHKVSFIYWVTWRGFFFLLKKIAGNLHLQLQQFLWNFFSYFTEVLARCNTYVNIIF